MDDYEIVESSVATSTVSLEASTDSVTILHRDATIYASPVQDQNDLIEHI
jgi:hypothetical protein